MDPTGGGRDSRYNVNYSMSIGLSMGENPADLYGNPNAGLQRPPSGGLNQVMNRAGGNNGGGLMGSPGGGGQCTTLSNSRGIKRTASDCYDDSRAVMVNSQQQQQQQMTSMDGCQGVVGVTDVVDDGFTSLQKKSPPANGKKTKGRVKIKMEYIDNKLRRYTTFSKRKTGIMKKAYELSTLTGTQVMLLVASETGHVYTFATRKLQPMITSEAGKQLIQTCLNSPDPPTGATGDQRMSATGFEETELSYNIGDEDSKDDRSPMSSLESDESSDVESPANSQSNNIHLEENMAQPEPLLVPKQEADTKSNLSHLNSLGSVLYPAAALGNLPQEVLLSLMQSGHLQMHQEQEGGHQFITIPLSMMPGGLGKMTVKDLTQPPQLHHTHHHQQQNHHHNSSSGSHTNGGGGGGGGSSSNHRDPTQAPPQLSPIGSKAKDIMVIKKERHD